MNTSLKSSIIISASLIVLGACILLGSFFYQQPSRAMAGVSLGNEYFGTTTSSLSIYPKINVLANGTQGTGALGSVIMTAVGGSTGSIDIYDATTTNVNARTGQIATTSLLLASIPNNLTVGTYQFDIKYKYGLLTVVSGTVGTTTITWR